jgi:hypothetical protein
MQIVRRHAVYCALDRRDGVERRMRGTRDLFREFHAIYQPVNLGHRSPVWLRWNIEIHFDAMNVGSLHVGNSNFYSRQSKRRRQAFEPGLVQADIDESADEHVPGDAARRIENRDFHGLYANTGFA